MSYDIYLFKKLNNKTVSESAETVLEETNINALDSEAFEQQKTSLAEKLNPLNNTFEEFRSDNHLELSSHNTGIQVSIFPNQIAVTVPYWHTGQEAERVFTEIYNYLLIIKQETGYSIYDPQSGTEMFADQGVEHFLQTYLGVSENIETIIQDSQANDNNYIQASHIVISTIIIFSVIIVMLFIKHK